MKNHGGGRAVSTSPAPGCSSPLRAGDGEIAHGSRPCLLLFPCHTGNRRHRLGTGDSAAAAPEAAGLLRPSRLPFRDRASSSAWRLPPVAEAEAEGATGPGSWAAAAGARTG